MGLDLFNSNIYNLISSIFNQYSLNKMEEGKGSKFLKGIVLDLITNPGNDFRQYGINPTLFEKYKTLDEYFEVEGRKLELLMAEIVPCYHRTNLYLILPIINILHGDDRDECIDKLVEE